MFKMINGSLVGMVSYLLMFKMINGSLVGMVSICAGADGYYPWAACVLAGIFKFSIFSLKLKLPTPTPKRNLQVTFLNITFFIL